TPLPSATMRTPRERRPYPLLMTAGRAPISASASATVSASGVLPLPPRVTLPTEMTGTGSRCVEKRPTRKEAERAARAMRNAAAAAASPARTRTGARPCQASCSQSSGVRARSATRRLHQVALHQLQRVLHGSLAAHDSLETGFSDAPAQAGIAQKETDLALEQGAFLDEHRAARLQQGQGALAEVVRVRPEEYGLSQECGLEHVVAARRHEAAPDEHDGRDPVELRQLPNRVENDHCAAVARAGKVGSADCLEPALERQALDLRHALRMPG